MEFNAQIIKKIIWKYIRISRNTIKYTVSTNAMDFMCDLEPFSEIRSHILSGSM